MQAKSRNTIQRQIVLDTVKSMHNHPSADEIYEKIVFLNPSISRATVYRNLKVLSDIGDINHIKIADSSDRYDFNTNNHYHFICESCRNVFDVDMPYLSNIVHEIKNTNGFLIKSHNIVFRGLCPSCKEK